VPPVLEKSIVLAVMKYTLLINLRLLNFRKSFFFLIFLTAVLGCSEPADNKVSSISKDTSTERLQSDITNALDKREKVALFSNNKYFEIVSAVKSTTTQSTDEDTTKCKSWNLTKEQVHKVIEDSKDIQGTEWDLSFSVLSCVIQGEILQAGQHYIYELNAGSWLHVTCGDTTLLLGNYKKADKKFFLAEAYEE
jgi:hypothetical protein